MQNEPQPTQPLFPQPPNGDSFAERARPAFLYLVMAILGFDYVFLPFLQLFGSKVQSFALPDNVLWLFGAGTSGYAIARSAEKIAGLPGDSQISVLGVKVGNKQ